MKNIFKSEVCEEIIERINQLTVTSQTLWGKMNVAQMLAHCNVTYELVFENKHPKPNALLRLILKLFVKNVVVNEKPFKRNSQTAPAFIIATEKDFEIEKARLKAYIDQVQKLGSAYFDGKESHSFGVLKATEWNAMFYKHLDHHLNQFGV
jgi:hypothetical protein